MTPQKPQKLLSFIKIKYLWAYKMFDNMTIYDHFCVFVSVLPSPILKKINYMRSINPRRYLIQILIKFPFECHRNHVWKPIFDPSYDNFYKCDHFVFC